MRPGGGLGCECGWAPAVLGVVELGRGVIQEVCTPHPPLGPLACSWSPRPPSTTPTPPPVWVVCNSSSWREPPPPEVCSCSTSGRDCSPLSPHLERAVLGGEEPWGTEDPSGQHPPQAWVLP